MSRPQQGLKVGGRACQAQGTAAQRYRGGKEGHCRFGVLFSWSQRCCESALLGRWAGARAPRQPHLELGPMMAVLPRSVNYITPAPLASV